MIFTIQLSLRQKITLGHGLIAIIIIILSVFTYIELRFLEKKLVSGEKIAEFFDTALELRRFEKNYFLYKQRSDYEENQVYIAKLLAMIENNHNDLVILLTESALTQLVQKITQYQYLMTHIDKSNRPLIRDIGKNIVTIAEKVAKTERELLKENLRHSINTFLLAIVLLSIFGIVIGRILSHLVVRPLRLMEENMDKIATGHFKKLQVPSNEREIRSLEAAFNHMLNALETQQRHLLQSEKLAALGTLLSGVAHELNNPLSNISSSCQILLEELDEVDINYFRELLTQIDIQTIRAQRIVYA
ncbi:MAG: HAMP domain-containing protein, partial [Thiomargarita sp.]|nr:HAMP domain-containing protein [Thiomargarita sp.]